MLMHAWSEHLEFHELVQKVVKSCTAMKVDPDARVLRLTDPDLVNYPFIYMEHIERLNLREPEGQAVLHKLAKDADVLIEANRPGVAKRLGYDYETLSKINPRIIFASVTGYGQTGPWKERPGHDVNYVAAAGALAGIITDGDLRRHMDRDLLGRAARDVMTAGPKTIGPEQFAAEALATIPEEFRRHVGNVRIQVDDFPSDEVENTMELETPFDLLGLYQGVSMMERGAGHIANDIDRIFLYRRPILDYWCESGEDLPHKFETGTLSHEGMAGTLGAIEYLEQFGEGGTRSAKLRAAWARLADYEQRLTMRLIAGLRGFKGLRIRGITSDNAMDRRVPTVSFTLDGHHPEALAKGFARDNIFVWSGHNYAIEPVGCMGLLDKGGVLRVGLAHYNTEAEVDGFLSALTRQVKAA